MKENKKINTTPWFVIYSINKHNAEATSACFVKVSFVENQNKLIAEGLFKKAKRKQISPTIANNQSSNKKKVIGV